MILGLSGRAYAGKDTIADHLVAEHGFRRIAFADALRSMLFTLNPIVSVASPSGDPKDIEVTTWQQGIEQMGYDAMKKWPEARRLMQVFGTEVMREQFGQNVWVDLTFRQVDAGDLDNWVVTDVRFENEMQAVHDRNGLVFRVIRPDAPVLDGHISEHALTDENTDYYDGIIYNSASIETLYKEIDSMLMFHHIC